VVPIIQPGNDAGQGVRDAAPRSITSPETFSGPPLFARAQRATTS
jgi:hypothetical protein